MPTELDLLFEKYFRDELTPAEQKKLTQILAANGPEAAQFAAFAQEWVLLGDLARQLQASPPAPSLRLAPHAVTSVPFGSRAGDDKVIATIYCAPRPPSWFQRSWPVVGALAAALALVAGGWFWWPSGPPELPASLESRGENVTVRRGAEIVRVTDSWFPRFGDVIRTGGDSKATLRFKHENTALTLSGHAELALVTTPAGKRLELNQGHLEAVVDKQPAGEPLVCVTPHATITVLGTRFFVATDDETTRVVVKEGRVRVTERVSQAVEDVVAGHLAVASPQTPPQVQSFQTSPRSALPYGWLRYDVGSIGLPGTVVFAPIGGAILLKGSGSDIAFEADSFHFLYQPWRGDADLVVRLVSFEETDPDAKAGIMIREDLSPGARHVMINFEPQRGRGGVDFRQRSAPGSKTSVSSTRGTPLPIWLRLVRRGDLFAGYFSLDGKSWNQVGRTVSLPLAEHVYVGLGVTSHDNTLTTSALLDNLSLRSPLP